jgi:hypothetical protein
LKFGRLIEGPPKPKGKIRNPENFAWGGGGWVKNLENKLSFVLKKLNQIYMMFKNKIL